MATLFVEAPYAPARVDADLTAGAGSEQKAPDRRVRIYASAR